MPSETAWARTAAEDLLAALARADVWWVVAAVAFHVGGQTCRGFAWREVLAVSWPAVPRRRVCAWHVCGSGLSGVLSPRGGDAVRMGLAKRELPGATWPALAGTLVAEASFETFCGLVVALVALSIGVGMLTAPSGALVLGIAAAVGVVALLASRWPRLRRAVTELGRGVAVLRDPRRFVTRVVPWQVAGRALRMTAVWCFLHAAGLPAAPAVVIAAVAVGGSGSAIPIPGAGIATAYAGLLIALPIAAGRSLDPAAVATLAILQPACLTVVGVTLSLVLLSTLAGVRSPRALVACARGGLARSAPAPVAVPAPAAGSAGATP